MQPAGYGLGASIVTGHSPFPPRSSISGFPTVLVDGIPVLTVGQTWNFHCAPNQGCHTAPQATGSPTVLIGGLPAGRVGDLIGCGSTVATGSSTVLIG